MILILYGIRGVNVERSQWMITLNMMRMVTIEIRHLATNIQLLPYQVEFFGQALRHIEYEGERMSYPCPGCNGTGQYQGLFNVSQCDQCNGTGRVDQLPAGTTAPKVSSGGGSGHPLPQLNGARYFLCIYATNLPLVMVVEKDTGKAVVTSKGVETVLPFEVHDTNIQSMKDQGLWKEISEQEAVDQMKL